MATLITLQGNNSGEGFLIAPFGDRVFQASLGLRMDSGTASVTIRASPDGAGLVFSQAAIDLTTTEKIVQIHATAQSAARNDTVIEILSGTTVQAAFNITAISNPVIHFKGRFQARFATDSDKYNLNPKYGSDPAEGNPSPGWTWILEGEPDFVPAAGNVPTQVDMAVGRVIRLNNPISLRSHSLPVTTVVGAPAGLLPVGTPAGAIEGQVGTGSEFFDTGDQIIGMPVNLGADTYFAGNKAHLLSDGLPEEQHNDAREPLANFEFHIGAVFSGTSQIGPYTGATLSGTPRIPDHRPITPQDLSENSFPSASAERAEFGLPSLQTWSDSRIDQLMVDYGALTAGQRTDTANGRNLRRRIGHLLASASFAKLNEVSNIHPEITSRSGTLAPGWTNKEVFTGKVDANVQITPNNSAVLDYFGEFTSFDFNAALFSFHSDEMCAYIKGFLAAETSSTVPDFNSGVYSTDSAATGAFQAMTVAQFTPAAVDGALGVAPTVGRTVVTVSQDLIRLVVSHVTIADEALAPVSWEIATRTDTWIGELIPEASVVPRSLLYLVLPPGHAKNVLGACEGTAPAPPPTVGYARVWYDAGPGVWRYLLHAGDPGNAGETQRGVYAGSPATQVPACNQPELELLTPTVDFGNVETGMILHREIVLLNRSPAEITVQLPILSGSFSQVGDGSAAIAAGTVGTVRVAFTAGAPGSVETLPVTLTSVPVATGSLDVMLRAKPVDVQAVDVVLVLDRSGSMIGPAFTVSGVVQKTKAKIRNEAAQVLVDLLRPGDRVGMVRYDDIAEEHLAMVTAGDGSAGSGKELAATALQSPDLNPRGSTSIGGALEAGDNLLSGATPSAQKAIIVLSDGKENTGTRIPDAILNAGAKIYAIGIGMPDGINVELLDAVTGNSGGYQLLTGEMDAEAEYTLQKYYTQILSGIANDQIVVDPRGVIGAGEEQRTVFHLGPADAHNDIVLLRYHPILEFWLEAPDGTRLDPGSLGGLNAQFIQGRQCLFYHLDYPVFPGTPERGHGRWAAVVRYPGDPRHKWVSAPEGDLKLRQRDLAALLDPLKMRIFQKAALNHRAVREAASTGDNPSASYNVVVRSRSSLRMEVGLIADTLLPFAARRIVVQLTAFGLPYAGPAELMAEITGPDGGVSFIPLVATGPGRFEARLEPGLKRGGHNVTVRALGTAPGGGVLQREQTLSIPVVVPQEPSGGDPRFEDLQQRLTEVSDALDSFRQVGHPIWLPIILVIIVLVLLIILFSITVT